MLNKLDLSWVAGFYEGEGSCGAYTKTCYVNGKKYIYPKKAVKLCIAQKSRSILLWVQEFFGDRGSIHFQKSGFGNGVYMWSVCCNDARYVMKQLRPYLKMKHRQRKIAEILEAK